MLAAALAAMVYLSPAPAPAIDPPALMPVAQPDPCVAMPQGILCTNEGFVAIMKTCADTVKATAQAHSERGQKAFWYGALGSAALVAGVSGAVPSSYTGTRWSLNIAGAVSLLTGLWFAVVPPDTSQR